MSGFPFLKKLRGFRVRGASREIELQDVFLDKLVQEQKKEMGGLAEEGQIEIPLSRWLLWGLYAAFILTIGIFSGKTFYLQAFAGEELQEMAEQNAIRSFPLGSERGVVYDSSMTQLVFNKPSFDFVCDKRDLPEDRQEKEAVLRESAAILEISYPELRARFDEVENPRFLVEENISRDQLIQFDVKQEELQGCHIQKNTVREYLDSETLAHILGYTAKVSAEELRAFPDYFVTDQIGKTGLERSYESELRGEPGKSLVEKDALGNVITDRGTVESEPGNSLVLWLDLELQEKIEESLRGTLARIGAKKAVGIAMDPNTGGVLSLVSIPGFDNNLFAQGISQEDYNEIIENPLDPLFNRAIAGTYPTGSTIKPFIAPAALEESIIQPEKELFTYGYIEIENEYDPEIVYRFNDNADHGWVNMRDALAVSSNVYFYTIGGGFEEQDGLGPSRIKQYLEKFGWGERTGIDLPGETKGLIPDPAWKLEAKGEGWWDGDTYLFSIGQGNVLATPLQVASSFVPIANGGTLYKPHMVREIIDAPDDLSEGEVRRAIDPELANASVIDKENLEVVREGMQQAVKWGSSVLLNQVPVSVAAKTGTAQTGRQDSEGRDLLYSWVSVFAPYENPEIVLTVMVEEAQVGSLVVLPVAKEVLEWYFTKHE